MSEAADGTGATSYFAARCGSSDSRVASTAPADPAPTMMTLYCMAALLPMVMVLCWRDDIQRYRLSQFLCHGEVVQGHPATRATFPKRRSSRPSGEAL